MAARPVITLAVLQEMLQAEEPSVVLESFEMSAGSGRGDNYTAMVYRVALQGRQDGAEWRGSIICKVLPTSARRRDAYKSDALFRNEVAFYTRALPALQRFEARRGQADAEAGATASCTAAVPRCFRAQDNLVVLEDLRTRGFTMVDRRQGLGEKQLRTVLSRVARFHGLSLAMKALQPEEFNREVVGSIRETQFLASNEGWYGGYYRTINKHVLNMVHDGLPEGEERARCLAAASAFLLEGEGETASFFKRMVSLVQPVEPLAVLCHGDCWTSNFMFRYDDKGHLEDEVMLVDYQMSRYASPCLDLMLLLYSCTDRPVREARMDALLRHYHATLLDTMHRLGCTEADYAQPDVLWDMLTSEMHRLGRFGLGQAVDYVPCLCCESEEAPNVYDGQGDDEDLKDGDGSPSGAVVQGPAPIIIENERCVRMLADLVQELVAKGDL